MRNTSHSSRTILLIIIGLGVVLSLKDCFCTKRIDGYSRNALQLYFLDYGKRSSVDSLISQLVGQYNSIVRQSREAFPQLPYITKVGEGVSTRRVVVNAPAKKLPKKNPGSKPKKPQVGKSKRFTQVIDTKHIYRMAGQTFYLYYYPWDKNKVTLTIHFTNTERLADRFESVAAKLKQRPFDNKLVLKDQGAGKKQDLGNWADMGRKNLNQVGGQKALDKLSLKKRGLLGQGQISQQYTLSHYMEYQFEFDLCANFQIFVDKMLRAHFGFARELHPKFGTPLFGVSSLLLNVNNKCQKVTRKYQNYVPADITRLDKKALTGLVKSSIGFETIYRNARPNGIYGEALNLLIQGQGLHPVLEESIGHSSSGNSKSSDLIQKSEPSEPSKQSKDQPRQAPGNKFAPLEFDVKALKRKPSEGKDAVRSKKPLGWADLHSKFKLNLGKLSKSNSSGQKADRGSVSMANFNPDFKKKKPDTGHRSSLEPQFRKGPATEERRSSLQPKTPTRLSVKKDLVKKGPAKKMTPIVTKDKVNFKVGSDLVGKPGVKGPAKDNWDQELRQVFSKRLGPNSNQRDPVGKKLSTEPRKSVPLKKRNDSLLSLPEEPPRGKQNPPAEPQKKDFMTKFKEAVAKKNEKENADTNGSPYDEDLAVDLKSKAGKRATKKPVAKDKKPGDFNDYGIDVERFENIVNLQKAVDFRRTFSESIQPVKQDTTQKVPPAKGFMPVRPIEDALADIFRNKPRQSNGNKDLVNKSSMPNFPFSYNPSQKTSADQPAEKEKDGIKFFTGKIIYTPAPNQPKKTETEPNKQDNFGFIPFSSDPKRQDNRNLPGPAQNKKGTTGDVPFDTTGNWMNFEPILKKNQVPDEIRAKLKKKSAITRNFNIDPKTVGRPTEDFLDLGKAIELKPDRINPRVSDFQPPQNNPSEMTFRVNADKEQPGTLLNDNKPSVTEPNSRPRVTNPAAQPDNVMTTRDEILKAITDISKSTAPPTQKFLDLLQKKKNFVPRKLLRALPPNTRAQLKLENADDLVGLSSGALDPKKNEYISLAELLTPVIEDSRKGIQTSPQSRVGFSSSPLDLKTSVNLKNVLCSGLTPITHDTPIVTDKIFMEVDLVRPTNGGDDSGSESEPGKITGEVVKSRLAVNRAPFIELSPEIDRMIEEAMGSDADVSFMIESVNEEIFDPGMNISFIRSRADQTIVGDLFDEGLFTSRISAGRTPARRTPVRVESRTVDLHEPAMSPQRLVSSHKRLPEDKTPNLFNPNAPSKFGQDRSREPSISFGKPGDLSSGNSQDLGSRLISGEDARYSSPFFKFEPMPGLVERKAIVRNMIAPESFHDLSMSEPSFISELQSFVAISEIIDAESKLPTARFDLVLERDHNLNGDDEDDGKDEAPFDGEDDRSEPDPEERRDTNDPTDQEDEQPNLVMRSEEAILEDLLAMKEDGLLAAPGTSRPVVFDSAKTLSFIYADVVHPGNIPSPGNGNEPDVVKMLRLDFQKKVDLICQMVKTHATMRKNVPEQVEGGAFKVYDDLTIDFTSDEFRNSLLIYVLSFYQYQLVISEVEQNITDNVVTVEDHIRFHDGKEIKEMVFHHTSEVPGLDQELYEPAMQNRELRAIQAGKDRRNLPPRHPGQKNVEIKQ